MYCIVCWNENTKVIDSRESEDGKAIRRRRECENCHNRFTTYEKIEIINLIVEKSWNRKEKYDRNKLEWSIYKSINKRKISILTVNGLINQLEIKWSNLKEITSAQIWEEVMKMLLELDEIAYIRYASVHLNIDTANEFIEFIKKSIK